MENLMHPTPRLRTTALDAIRSPQPRRMSISLNTNHI